MKRRPEAVSTVVYQLQRSSPDSTSSRLKALRSNRKVPSLTWLSTLRLGAGAVGAGRRFRKDSCTRAAARPPDCPGLLGAFTACAGAGHATCI